MKAKWVGVAVAFLLLGVLGLYSYQRWGGSTANERATLLSLLPSDATAAIYADVDALRNAPFFSALYAWAPQPQMDANYAQFVNATGFAYERDVDRLAIAVRKRGAETVLFAVVDGRFDRKKIAAYTSKFGSVGKLRGQDIYSFPINEGAQHLAFVFLSGHRLAITESPDVTELLDSPAQNLDAKEWREHFARLAGTPLFAAIRPDAATGSALATQAPGGLRSPQLATLLNSLQWITVAAKPQENGLRVVAEGECPSESAVKQLTDMLNGIVQLAQMGLNDPQTRQQLAPAAREAYLDLLHSTDITKMDRGGAQSVRVVFDLTPKFLAAARAPGPPQLQPTTPSPAVRKK